jgi:hypothetical protein
MGGRKLDDWIETFLEYTDNTEPSPGYRRWVAISAVASVLQRKCWLKWGSETFHPNLYIVLVGPPAARKGTAMRPGKDLLDEIGIAVSADESSRQKLIQAMMDVRTTEQTEEGELNMHSSLTIFSTELTVFLGYESKEMISMLCKFYDCESRFIYDTVSRGKEEIPNVWLNLIGATTPGQLQASLPSGAIGSGFTSRIVFVYSENKGKMVILPTIDNDLRHNILTDLEDIRSIAGEFHLTEEASAIYTAWRIESEGKRIFTDQRLDYYVQRRPTHLFKLAMIHSAARNSSRLVSEEDLTKAIQVLHSAEREMENVFAGIGANPMASVQNRMKKHIKSRELVTREEIFSMFSDDASPSQIQECISGLQTMKLIHVDLASDNITYKDTRGK